MRAALTLRLASTVLAMAAHIEVLSAETALPAPSMPASSSAPIYRVQVVEDEEAAKTDVERWRAEREHEQADLVAQQRSALAAESQVWIAGAAAALSFIALIVAIRSSRGAAKAYEHAERAWVGMHKINYKEVRNPNPAHPAPDLQAVEVHPTLRNFGNSPALECRVYSDLKFLDRPEQQDPPQFIAPGQAEWGNRAMPLMPGSEVSPSRVVIPIARLLLMRDNTTLRAFMYVRVEYRDVLSREWRMTESCHEVVIVRWIADPALLRQPVKVEMGCRQLGPQNNAT